MPEQLASRDAEIWALAFEDDAVVSVSGACGRIRILTLGGSVEQAAGSASGGYYGDRCQGYEEFKLGFAGRVAWGGIEACCNEGYGAVYLSAPGTRTKLLTEYFQRYHYWGGFLTGVAGDGTSLVFSLATTKRLGSEECLERQTCRFRVSRGAIHRVVGRKTVRIPQVPVAALLAASEGMLAVVPASTATSTEAAPQSNPEGRVEIRAADTGSLIAAFNAPGPVVEVAFSDGLVATLTGATEDRRVSVFSAPSASLEHTIPVTGETSRIDISKSHLVFATPSTIEVVDLATSAQTTIAEVSALAGLGIERRDVVWADNRDGRGAILRVALAG